MMLCATLKQDDLNSIQCANKQADLLEIRLDLFTPKNLKKLREACQIPVIFVFDKLNLKALDLSPDYVDIPASSPTSLFDQVKNDFPHIQRICSHHDFEKTEDLENLVQKIQAKEADVNKIATLAHSTLDALSMLKCVKKQGIVGICMGEFGMITRILASACGAPWTYAPLAEENKTAPGQLLLDDLVHTYNVRSHSNRTALFGLIGDPVSKSPSHQTHNFAFKKLGLDAVYVKMRVQKEELATFFPLCRELGFQGLSVTMPLKQAVIPYLDQFDSEAINTIALRDQVFGWNTDGRGALDAIEKRAKVKDKTVVVLGAGGAAIGIAKEARLRGAHLIICNRTFSKAMALAKQVGGNAFTLENFSKVSKEGYDILINCTSVGMGEDKRLPVLDCDLLPNRLVMDAISNPLQTELLIAAKQKKCRIIQGIEMFIQQATLQYCHWFEEKIR